MQGIVIGAMRWSGVNQRKRKTRSNGNIKATKSQYTKHTNYSFLVVKAKLETQSITRSTHYIG